MNAAIFGATGMVGIEVLHCCLDESRVRSVLTIGRRASGISHPKLRWILDVDFGNLDHLCQDLVAIDTIFYCLGVYQGRVSDKEFWEITCTYLQRLLLVLAKVGRAPTFCLMSAIGADRSERSPFLFARAKGRAEKILVASSLHDHYIVRPGYIAPGRRAGRSRIPDWLANPIFRVIPAIGISAVDLARVLVSVGIDGADQRLLHNRDLRRMASSMWEQ